MRIPKNRFYENEKWLREVYSEKGLRLYQIRKLCGVRHTTIKKYIKKFKIPYQNWGETYHLAKTNHCILSKEAIEWISGELLGDGCLALVSPYSARFQYGSKYLEYIQYISDTLKSFGIEQSGKIYKRSNSWGTFYQYKTKSYPELKKIHDKFYIKGKKIIPKELKLTPLTCRQWYIGDGCLKHPKDSRPRIVLSTDGFNFFDVEYLINQFNILKIKATKQGNNRTAIWACSTKDFLNYIGECPVNCYQYKWAY